MRPETQCALIQRSCGYSWRKTLTVAEIEAAIIIIKVRSAYKMYSLIGVLEAERFCFL